MEVSSAAIIILMIMIIYYLYNHSYIGKEPIVASDGEKYYVVSGYENQQGAAEMLSYINRNVLLYLKYLKIKYRVNYTEGSEMYAQEALTNIVREFDKESSSSPQNTSIVSQMSNPIMSATNSGINYVKNAIGGFFSVAKDGFAAKDGFSTHSHYSRPVLPYRINPESSVDSNYGFAITEALVGNANSDTEMFVAGNSFSNSAVDRLLSGYDLENIMENDPKASGDNTYTVDKGARMVVCLRDRKTFKLHDKRIVMFVVLHELAHIANERWGHTSESQFWEIFKFLLHEAKLCGMHEPVDYSKQPVMYCGLNVNYNPYFDDNVKKMW